MKLLVLAVFAGVCSAARLENTYLPPGNARTAGGSGNFLAAPRHSGGTSGSFGASGSFGHGGSGGFGGFAAKAHSHAPAPVYGAPAAPGVEAAFKSYQTAHSSGPQVPILKYSNDNAGDGSYHFEYETGDGTHQEEQGQLKNAGSDNEINEVYGSYSYTGPDGVQYTVKYIANENGFQPIGDHLPTPPPVPEAIQRSLEYNAAHGSSDNDDGSYQESSRQQYQPSKQYLAPRQQGSFAGNSGYKY